MIQGKEEETERTRRGKYKMVASSANRVVHNYHIFFYETKSETEEGSSLANVNQSVIS